MTLNNFKIKFYISKFLGLNGDPFQDIKKLIKKNETKVIFDCGANVCKITAKFKSNFPNSKIICFEPFIGSFSKRYEKYWNPKDIILINKAVSENSGVNQFYIYDDPTCNSLFYKPNNGKFSGDHKVIESITVDTVSIDDYCLVNSIRSIDILKLDIEGGRTKSLKRSN